MLVPLRSLTRAPWRCPAYRALLLTLALATVIPLHVASHPAIAASPAQPEQPTAAQIASALDLAAENALPPGYPTLEGVSRIPTVLLKAIAWVESDWNQVDKTGSPLISRDGGYGVMQITHGLGGIPVSAEVQSAIANNFVYNIACGAQLLSMKWTSTPRIGTGDPSVLEDWYYAVWAYNAWGWRNNPNNPRFTRSGTPLSNPAGFPYQERVFYLISHPPLGADGLPLWTAVPVSLPDAGLIGRNPGPLPAPASPHSDVAPTDGPLFLPRVDAAQFEADLTIPDGTIVAPGTPLHKVWLLHNVGGLFWSGYTWRFISGALMGAPLSETVPLAPPLSDVPVAIDLVAPRQPGQYKGYWQLFDQENQPVGPRAWISITVADAAQATAAAQLTPPATPSTLPITTAQLISATLSTPPATPKSLRSPPLNGIDNAAYVADLTIPDGTLIAPGQVFTKTWEIQNTGTRTWNSRYHWQFQAGAPMGRVRSVAAPVVRPGGTATFSVELVAPTQPGTYRGFWQMTDVAGNVFGSQATVVIRVGTATPPTNTPRPSTPTPTNTPRPTTPPAPTHTPRPAPTHRPRPTATPRPTVVPRPAQVTWFGPPASSAYFAEGYTGDGYHEWVSLLNPQPRPLRAQIDIFRADGATRTFAVSLGPLARRSLDLNLLAPRASTALRVEADAPAVVERALFTGNGHVVAGVGRPSHHWYVAEGYVGSGFRDELRIFNPGALAASVTIRAYRGDGSMLVSHRLVRAGTRSNVMLDDVAPIGSSALEISGSEPVVVESIVRGPGASGPSAAMALTAPSRAWYFPDGGTSRGNDEYVALYNPGNERATVNLHLVTASGYQAPITLHVGPHSRAVYVMHALIHLGGLAAIVLANHPIVAQEVRYARSGGTTVVDGAARPALTWGLAEGHTGDGFKEWVTLLNPGAQPAVATVHLVMGRGVARSVTVRLAARQRRFLYLNHLVPTGPVSAIVHADHPIVAGRTMIFNGGKGLSTTVGVALAGR